MAYDSPCKDTGNPNHDANDLGLFDLDGEDRIANLRVDIGADENNSCDAGNQGDVFNDIDWNLDGTVDGYELGIFADAWLTHNPNEPGYTPLDPETERTAWSNARRCNFNGGYYIDYGDFAVFAKDWLWRTCWKPQPAQGAQQSMAMAAPVAFGFTSLAEEPEPVERTTAQLVSLVEGIYAIIEYVETAIKEGHENAENLYEIKDILEEVLRDLQEER